MGRHIVPSEKAQPPHHKEQADHKVHQRVPHITCQGGEGPCLPHQVKARVAEGGDRVKNTIPNALPQPKLGTEPQRQQQGPNGFYEKSGLENESRHPHDSAHLRGGDGLLHHPALLQTDLPAGKHKDGHRHGHHPHAPHLDQQKDHPLSER